MPKDLSTIKSNLMEASYGLSHQTSEIGKIINDFVFLDLPLTSESVLIRLDYIEDFVKSFRETLDILESKNLESDNREVTVETVAEDVLDAIKLFSGELNDSLTRSKILQVAKSVFHYDFEIICDETTNPPILIEQNKIGFQIKHKGEIYDYEFGAE